MKIWIRWVLYLIIALGNLYWVFSLVEIAPNITVLTLYIQLLFYAFFYYIIMDLGEEYNK